MPRCCDHCVIILNQIGSFPPPPPLVRQTHRTCQNCTRSVSEYEHNLCYNCAPVGSVEFDYHHRRCLISNTTAPTAPSA